MPADEPAPVPFDPAQLDDVSGGDAGLALELVELLRGETVRNLARIDAALAAGDAAGVRAAAHAMKGSSATLGFLALADAALRLERAAAEGRPMDEAAAALRARLPDLDLPRGTRA